MSKSTALSSGRARRAAAALGAGALLLLGQLSCTGSMGEPPTAAKRSTLETMGPLAYGPDTGTFTWGGELIGSLRCTDWDDPRMDGTFAERIQFLDEKCTFVLPPDAPLPPDPCDAASSTFSVAADGQSYHIDQCESLDGQDPYTGATAVWHQVPDWSTSYDAECYLDEATGAGCCNFYVDIDPAELSECDAVYPGLRAPPPDEDGDGSAGTGDGSAGTGDGSAGTGDGSAGTGDGSAGTGDGTGSAGTGGATYGAAGMQAWLTAVTADPPPGPDQPGPPPPLPTPRSGRFLQWTAAVLLGVGTYISPFSPDLGRQLVRTADRIVRLVEAMRRGNNRQAPRNVQPGGAGAPPDPPPPGTQRRLEQRGGRQPPPTVTPPRPPRVLPPGGRPIPKPEMLPHPPVRPPLRPPIG